MQKRILLKLGILAVMVAIVVSWQKDEEPAREAADLSAPKTLDPTPAAQVLAAQTATGSDAQSAAPPPDPEFQKWLRDEAQQVNSTNVDSEQKTREVKKVLKTLTPKQAKQLLYTAHKSSAPAGERILSTYFLAEAGVRARAELQQLITAPVQNTGPHEPHSEAEVRAEQERALRMVGVEGLISQAEKDVSARQALEQTIPNIPDAYIRGYAQQRLEQIKRQ